MHCEEAESLLGQLVFDDLDPAVKKELAAHVKKCKKCRELAGDVRVAAKLLKEGVNAGPDPKLSEERKETLKAAAMPPAGGPSARAHAGVSILRRHWLVTAASVLLVLTLALAVAVPNLLSSRIASDAAAKRALWVEEGEASAAEATPESSRTVTAGVELDRGRPANRAFAYKKAERAKERRRPVATPAAKSKAPPPPPGKPLRSGARGPRRIRGRRGRVASTPTLALPAEPAPGITVAPTSGTVAVEGGGTARRTVALGQRRQTGARAKEKRPALFGRRGPLPGGGKGVGLLGIIDAEKDVARSTERPPAEREPEVAVPAVTFTAGDWSARQTVRVKSLDDVVINGSRARVSGAAPEKAEPSPDDADDYTLGAWAKGRQAGALHVVGAVANYRPDRKKQLVGEAETAVKAGDFDKAVSTYRKAGQQARFARRAREKARKKKAEEKQATRRKDARKRAARFGRRLAASVMPEGTRRAHLPSGDRAPAASAYGAAITDIPLGGTGVVGNLGVGGGAAGCFGFRSGGGRRRAALRGGGSRASESTVDDSLRWLVRNQRPGGSWSVKDSGGSLRNDADVGLTGLALLSFLGAGHTEKTGEYKHAVRKAVEYLVSRQNTDGSMGNNRGGSEHGSGYNHAIAGLALSEAYGMARVKRTGVAAQKAVDYSVNDHQRPMSGWRYRPRQSADVSVTGWFTMQLKSALIAGLKVDPKGFQGAIGFLERCTKRDPDYPGLASYRPGLEPTPTMTAIGLVMRQLMGWKRHDPLLIGAANYLMQNVPEWKQGDDDLYYWLYGTQGMYQMGGDWWKVWNASTRDMLVSRQRDTPHDPGLDGSWDPVGKWTSKGGRAVATALGALCLETYYRYLPIYNGGRSTPVPVEQPTATKERVETKSPRMLAAERLMGIEPKEKPAKEAAEPGAAPGPQQFVVLSQQQAQAIEKQAEARLKEAIRRQIETARELEAPVVEETAAPAEAELKEAQAPPEPAKTAVPPPPPVNPFVMTSKDRFSTFAMDVDTASYTIARKYVTAGSRPPPGLVRMEEYVNAFDYNYPKRSRDVFDIHSDGMPSPFGKGLQLLKIGIQARIVGREGRKPAHLVFVIDSSGSMEQPDRMPLVKYALSLLVNQLDTQDLVTVVSYGTRPRLVVEATAASNQDEITRAIGSLQCGGTTNMIAGLRLGYEQARGGFRPGAVNRVILCSDGVANVGASEAEEILKEIEKYRDWGITLTVAGFGAGSYNDRMLERLADSGDGHYIFIDSSREARRVFVEELGATLHTVAKDAKIQVEFDPRRVRRYRLVGYENRDIADKDFRNDAIDAGEVGSGQSVTALYEIELHEIELLEGERAARGVDIGTVYVRYRNIATGEIEEVSHRLRAEAVALRRRPKVEESPRLYLAACVAEFAEILRRSEHAAGGSLAEVERKLRGVVKALPLDRRVRELAWLVRRAKGLPRAE